MQRFLSRGSNKGEQSKDLDPTTDDTEGKDGDFSTLDGCIMIFGGLAAYASKHRRRSRAVKSIRPNWPHLPSSGGLSPP